MMRPTEAQIEGFRKRGNTGGPHWQSIGRVEEANRLYRLEEKMHETMSQLAKERLKFLHNETELSMYTHGFAQVLYDLLEHFGSVSRVAAKAWLEDNPAED